MDTKWILQEFKKPLKLIKKCALLCDSLKGGLKAPLQSQDAERLQPSEDVCLGTSFSIAQSITPLLHLMTKKKASDQIDKVELK